MYRPIAALLNLYTLTPGRRIFALGRVAERAKAKQLTALLDLIQAAMAQDRLALELAAGRATKSKLPDARGDDQAVDRALVAIEGLVAYFRTEGDPIATELLGAMFPTNVADHVQLPFIEQAAANERVLALLEGPQFASWIDSHGIRPLIGELRKSHDSFAAVLHTRDALAAPTWERVKAARELGQELYCTVVVRIAAEFSADPAAREELLEPIWAQNEQIRAYRRQRRRLIDVDPATGEPLVDEPEAEIVEDDAE